MNFEGFLSPATALPHGYSVRKAAQAVALFARLAKQPIHAQTISALVYLADRKSLHQSCLPILFDNYVSTEIGPAAWTTHKFIFGLMRNKIWDYYISSQSKHRIYFSRAVKSDEDLDWLNEEQVDVIKDTWHDKGHIDGYFMPELLQVTCPEWENPNGAVTEIPYARVFKFLGRQDSDQLAEYVESMRALCAAASGQDGDLHPLQERDAADPVRLAGRPQ